MSRVLISVVLLFSALVLPGCRELEAEREVRAAVDRLGSSNELEVRRAVRALGALTQARNIMIAVDPLGSVLSNPARDLVTRALVTDTLAVIARSRTDADDANQILRPLIFHLFSNQSDLLRSVSANALGRSGREEALRPLELAWLSDGSIMVRSAALDSLKALTGGSYEPPSSAPAIGPTEEGPSLLMSLSRSTGPEGLTPEAAAPASCLSPETAEWLRSHVIVINNAEALPPVCASGVEGAP